MADKVKQELLLTPGQIKQEIEKIFASVVSLSPAEHKNVMGGKWKFIDAVAEWVEAQLARVHRDRPGREEIAKTPVETHKYKGKRYLTLNGIDQILALLDKYNK